MLPQQNSNIKNLGAISLQYLKDFLENAPAWQISVGYWDKILFSNNGGNVDFESMITELSNKYGNQLLTIKASKSYDKNGNMPASAEKFRFYMPPEINDTDKEEMFFELFAGSGNLPLFYNSNNTQQTQQNQSSQFPVLLQGMPQNQNNQQQSQINLGELMQQFEIKTKNLLEEQRLQYEKDRIKEWANGEIEKINKMYSDAEEKLKAAEEVKAKYEEKISKIVPHVGDIVSGVINGVVDHGLDFFKGKTLSGIKKDEKKPEVKKEEVQKGSQMTFKVIDNNSNSNNTEKQAIETKKEEKNEIDVNKETQEITKEDTEKDKKLLILKMIEELPEEDKDVVLEIIDKKYYEAIPDETEKDNNKTQITLKDTNNENNEQ